MTYSEMTEIPVPHYLMPGNTIQFTTNFDSGWEDFTGVGMITEIDFDYCSEEDDELDWSYVRFCPTIQCGDGKVRYSSLYYTRVDHQTSSLAVEFDNEIYEPDLDLNGGSTLIIHEVFEC